MANTIQDEIETNAKAGIASASVDGSSVNATDISKQIEADRYIAAKAAASKNHFGLWFAKLESPGAG